MQQIKLKQSSSLKKTAMNRSWTACVTIGGGHQPFSLEERFQNWDATTLEDGFSNNYLVCLSTELLHCIVSCMFVALPMKIMTFIVWGEAIVYYFHLVQK